jgi:flagellar motor switch protein FliN/FliY
VSDDKKPLDLDEIEASLDEDEIDLVPVDADRQAEAAADDPVPSRVAAPEDLGAIYDIPVQLSAVLGKTTMPVSQLLRLGRGAVVELDRKVGESIDILVNNRLVARGEVVVVDDRLGVTMTEIIKGDH